MEHERKGKRVSDQELLNLLEQEPSQGMELLIEAYSGLLWKMARNYLDNVEDQKDCVNETFEQFYYNRKRFDLQKGSVASYLAGILQKRAISMYRCNNAKKWEKIPVTYKIQDLNLERAEQNVDLQQAFAALKTDEMELIRMKYYKGMTVKEIADSLNISYETVKKRHQRTLSKLRKVLLLVLALVLAGILTACAIRILQHFGIIPGYGINQDQKQKVYILEEPKENIKQDYSFGIEDAVFKDEKGVVRLWQKKHNGNDQIASKFTLICGQNGDCQRASQISCWNKNGIDYIELIFKNLELPDDRSGKLSYLMSIEFEENRLDFKMVAASEEQLEDYPYCITKEGGILANPILQDGNLLVSIYPLNLGNFEIEPALVRNIFTGYNDEAKITVKGEDGDIKQGECIDYHPMGSEQFFQWNFGKALPGEYTLQIPFVYEKATNADVSIPVDLKNMKWSKVCYSIPGGTVEIKECVKVQEEINKDYDCWNLKLQFNSDDPKRSLVGMPLALLYQSENPKSKISDNFVNGNIHIVSVSSDETISENNIQEYKIEIQKNSGDNSKLYLTTQNILENTFNEIWYRWNQEFKIMFEVQ